MLHVEVITSAAEMDRLQDRWNAVTASMPRATIFQSFAWNRLAAEMFVDRERPHIIVAESDNGIAILPAVVRRSGELGLLGEALFDYRDLISTGDSRLEAATFAKAAEVDLPLHITALRGDDAADEWQDCDVQYFVNAPALFRAQQDHAAYLHAHSRLGSRSRRIARKQIARKTHKGTDADLVRYIYERKAEHNHPDPSLFQDALRREFMQRICETDPSCEIFTYETAEDVVAAIVTFRGESIRHFYTVYFDHRWAEMSPGQMLLFEAAGDTLEQGLDCDFMTGEYPYKNRIATAQVPLYRVFANVEQLRTARTTPIAA